MVTITNNQLIISIDAPDPVEHLSNLQAALIALMQNFEASNHKDAPIYFGLELLKELMPTTKEEYEVLSK